MIHLIYIYFIINAFVAGIFHNDLNNWKYTLCWLLFGCLYPLLFIISIIGWLDRKTHFTTLLTLYFTNWFGKNPTGKGINALKCEYKKANKYGRWVLRQIDKKYNYGITK